MKVLYTVLIAAILGQATPVFGQALTIVSGNGQVVIEQFKTTAPLTVRATDAAGRPLPNVSVTWTVSQGQGSVFVSQPQTDANGISTADFVGTSLPPGTSFLPATVTASSPAGAADFIVTTTMARLPAGGQASPPEPQLLAPANYAVSGSAGSILPGAVSIRVVALSGLQQGQGVPNVGVRIAPVTPSPDGPAAACNAPGGTVLTDQTGLATCDLVLNRNVGTSQFVAVVGEYRNTPYITLTITPGQACTYTLTPASQSLSAGAGTGSVAISSGQGCSWTAVSNATWINITSGASGSGSGSLTYSAAANTTGAARSGTLTIGSQTFTVTQAAAGTGGNPLAFTGAATLPGATAGQPYSVTLGVSGGTPSYTWRNTTPLPAGLSLNSANGQLSGTATTAGQYSFGISATDAGNATVSQTFNLTVAAGTGGTGLQITTSSFPAGLVGVPYQQSVSTSGGCSNPFSPQPVIAVASGALPAGLSLQQVSGGSYAITGTPGVTGAFPFTLRASDACNAVTTRDFVLLITGSSASGGMTAAPATLSFTAQAGNVTAPAPQQLALDLPDIALPFSATTITTSGGSWLTVSPASGRTPATLNVSAANTGSLAPGTYAGSVVITSAAPNSPLVVPVTLTVTASVGVTVAPVALVFDENVAAGPATAQQTVAVTSAVPGVAFNASVLTFTGGNWLSVLPASGTTASNIVVTANASGMAVGTYKGSVSVAPVGNSAGAVTIPVTLNVTNTAVATVSPSALTFTLLPGAAAATQSLNVASSGAPLKFTASANAPWINVTPATGVTPATLTVSVSPGALQPGLNTGLISILPENTATPINVTVSATLSSQAAPLVTAVTNAASFAPGPVAPGEIITIFGTNLGGTDLIPLHVTADNKLDTVLGDTRVLFNDIPAPLLYVSAGQVAAIVSYEVQGNATVRMQVERQGIRTEAREIRVVDAVPAIFELDTTGQGAILNQDYSVNGTDNGAEPGSVVSIFATGEGQTKPAGVTGRLMPSVLEELARPLLPVTAQIGGKDAEVLYAGSAPGLPAGMLQVNVRIPAEVQRNAAVPIVLNIGGLSSQAGVTVRVK